jgi:hypothetical protein
MQCAKCGAIISNVGALTHCEICGDLFNSTDSIKNTVSGSSEIPWENMENIGIIKALFQTIYTCIVKPSTFFALISTKSSLFHAWLFGLVAGSIGILCDFLWHNHSSDYLDTFAKYGINSASSLNASILIFSPLILFLTIALISLYIHFLLILTRGRHNDLKSTVITICYSQSIAVLNIIPFFGNIISPIWGLYIIIAGISCVHKISKIRSSLTILLPVIFFLLFILFIAIIIIGSSILSSTLFKEIIPLFR